MSYNSKIRQNIISNPIEPACTGCSGSCSGGCGDSCRKGCAVSCSSSCENTCRGDCSTTCSGGCSSNCGYNCAMTCATGAGPWANNNLMQLLGCLVGLSIKPTKLHLRNMNIILVKGWAK